MVMEESGLGWVRVYGPFDLRGARGEPVRLAARSAMGLIALLALRGRGATRAEIADTLWPLGEHESARAALRTAVHRVRRAFGEEAIVDEDGRLRLALTSDAAVAARLRRARRRAADGDEALTAAVREWAIVRHELLEGWEDEWIGPLRDDARSLANECGTALARLFEERGEPQDALDALDGVLAAVPYQIEALEHAMRLESALHGRERALARAAEARASLPKGEGLALPASVRRLERALRDDAAGYLPPPLAFSDGGDLTLIGHMLEGSLRQGGVSGLAFLAEQAFSPVCMRHPYRTLDLLKRALRMSEGFGPERLAVHVAAISFGLNVGDRATVFELCDVMMAQFPPEHRLHNGSVLAKGTVCMEGCDFVEARAYTERAVAEALTEERRIVAAAQLGFIDILEVRLDRAREPLEAALAALAASERADRHRNMASIEGWIGVSHALQGRFDAVIESMERALAYGECVVPTEVMASSHLGFALLMTGRREEGVERIRQGLRQAHRERMTETFAGSLEVAAAALARLGDARVADATLDAANVFRRTRGLKRAPSARHFVDRFAGMDPDRASPGPLRFQGSGALSEWIGEALERAL